MGWKTNFKKGVVGVLTAALLVSAQTPIVANAAWEKDGVGWWWQDFDGGYAANEWRYLGGEWYHFNNSGYMDTGWLLDGGIWYYLDESGAMKTDWFLDGDTWYYLGADGAMRTGWNNIGGTYYYLNSDGSMAADTWVDGYYLDASGAWIEGATGGDSAGSWVEADGKWTYKKSDGTFVKADWLQIGSDWYFFDEQGYMVTGWRVITGYWYYFGTDGCMQSDTWVGSSWLNSDGHWECTEEDKTYTVDLGNGQTATVVGHFDVPYATRVLYLLNEYRQENGLAALSENSILKEGADLRAYEIANSFSHTRPNGASCFTAFDKSGFWGLGENIAMGYTTPDSVMDAWKNSSGHNANMLGEDYTYAGIGVFAEKNGSGYVYNWVQLFGY